MIVTGALMRYFYNVWHLDHDRAPWWAWGVAAFAILCAFGFAATASPGMRCTHGARGLPAETASLDEPKAPQEVVDVVADPLHDVPRGSADGRIGKAPKGVLLDTPEHIARFAAAIRQQAVLTHAMPPNNFSQMTDDERKTLAR